MNLQELLARSKELFVILKDSAVGWRAKLTAFIEYTQYIAPEILKLLSGVRGVGGSPLPLLQTSEDAINRLEECCAMHGSGKAPSNDELLVALAGVLATASPLVK